MPLPLTIALVSLAGLALAGATYLGLERLGRRAWLPLLCRAVAWTALGLLLLDVSCAVPARSGRPLVLLDGSISMTAAGGQWRRALDSATSWGEVRTFGDVRPASDTEPNRGRSLLAPALVAAAAGDRRIVVASDGQISDRSDIPEALLARSAVRLFPRAARPDLAITALDGPGRILQGDTLRLEIELSGLSGFTRDSISIEVTAGTRVLARRRIGLGSGTVRDELLVPIGNLAAGDQVFRIAATNTGDDEPRTDVRYLVVRVTEAPGVVMIASPGDWDSRFLYRAMRSVSDLPVRGYIQLRPGHWRDMATLASVSEARVRQAAAGADLLVIKGAASAVTRNSRARARWLWPSGADGAPLLPGDWYLSATANSPVAPAFSAAPVDSLPPLFRLTPLEPAGDAWIGLTARLGRQGAARPVMTGRETSRRREVTVAADGFWRWAFRGGSSEQAYRSWVAATLDWLLGGADSAVGRARVAQAAVQAGRPVVFDWSGGGAAAPLPVSLTDSAGARIRSDTLRFDGAGRAELWLPVGAYRYQLAGGGAGLVMVEPYSDELLPHPVVLTEHAAAAANPTTQSRAREWSWLFAICVVGLAGEWFARRRLGLR